MYAYTYVYVWLLLDPTGGVPLGPWDDIIYYLGIYKISLYTYTYIYVGS